MLLGGGTKSGQKAGIKQAKELRDEYDARKASINPNNPLGNSARLPLEKGETLINETLRQAMQAENLKTVIRKTIREEMRRAA